MFCREIKAKHFGRMALLLAILAIATLSFATNHYIVPGGTGNATGNDWSNANADLPSTPVCGDTYFVAGGTYSIAYSTSAKVWTNNCTSGDQVFVYKAVDCVLTNASYCGRNNPASVAGWQASYGTNQAVFSQTTDPDPLHADQGFIQFCGNYYTIDGVVPLTGTPSSTESFGIVFRSSNKNSFLGAGSGVSGCPQYNVSTASWASGSATITTTATHTFAVGEVVDIWNVSPGGYNGEFTITAVT